MEENQDGHWLKNQEEEIMMIVGKCKYAPNVEDHSYNFLKSVDIYLKKSSVRLDSTESGVHILRFSFFFFFPLHVNYLTWIHCAGDKNYCSCTVYHCSQHYSCTKKY